MHEFIDRVNKNFGNKYEMGCQISIDDSLIAFKGRLSYRQFIPSKQARFGIKCWVLADAGNSFVSCFHIYTGRNANADADVPLSTRVVRQLVEGYENVHHQLYVDNFYTLPALFQWLLDRGICACGTVRKGRVGFPRAIYFQRGRHEHGTTSYLTCGDLLAQSWSDSKEVYFLSTIHSGQYPASRPIANRTVRRRDSTGPIDVPAPSLLHDYNHYMGGVDLADIILQHYGIGRKTFQAYRRILYHGIELCVHNVHIVERFFKRPGQAGTLRRGALALRMALAELLVSQHRAMACHSHVGKPRLTEAERLVNVRQHQPFFRLGKVNNRDCRVCEKKARELHKRQHPGGGGREVVAG